MIITIIGNDYQKKNNNNNNNNNKQQQQQQQQHHHHHHYYATTNLSALIKHLPYFFFLDWAWQRRGKKLNKKWEKQPSKFIFFLTPKNSWKNLRDF